MQRGSGLFDKHPTIEGFRMTPPREHTPVPPLTPVFVGGCPRSGTTLLGSVLGTIPGCVVTPESTFKNALWRASAGGSRRLEAGTITRLLRNHFRYRLWGLPPAEELIPEGGQTAPEAIRLLVAEYARQRGEPEPTHWIDHTPRNLRHAFGLLRMFPRARFIHIVRDGRAVASSVMPLDWGPNTPAAAARWWARRLGEGVVAEGYLSDFAVVHRVRYEDLVTKPQETIGALSEAVFQAEVRIDLGGLGNAMNVPEYTRSQHQLIGQPPDPSRADAWKKKLSDSDIEEFEFVAGGILEHLGYETRCPAPRGPGSWPRIRRTFVESWRGMKNSLRRRARTRLGGG